MWKNLKKKVKNVFRFFNSLSKNGELGNPNNQELLQTFENTLNKSADSDMQMQINGKWVSKSLIEAISADDCQQKLLKICRQKEVHQLEQIFPEDINDLMDVLWSGCYSEVFRIKNLNGEDIVLKVSLINRLDKEGGVIQSAQAILCDVINSKRLSDLKAIPVEMADNYSENFANIKGFLYVWSPKLVFNKSEFKGKRNSKYEYFISQQTFAGKQLDSVISLSPTKAYSIVLQMTASLAAAEDALHFEHRDLHLSNLLIQMTEDKHLNYSIGGKKFHIKLFGVKLVIIDTTFARTHMKVDNDKQDVKYFYNDLTSLNLEDYPNPILKKIYLQQKQITGNNWREFYPKTNIIWLSYCVNRIYKMVENWSKKHTIPSDSNYAYHLSKLKQIRHSVDHSKSAKDFAQFCKMI